jgi:hypothetical protein
MTARGGGAQEAAKLSDLRAMRTNPMPDPKTLKVGDKVRVIAVPASDLREYERSGYGADVIKVLKWMVGKTFKIVTVDEYHPWIDYEMPVENGKVQEGIMALMDADSWERVDDTTP